jgi:GntR family transcriptional regulator, vanillate catabolism transcriptional regulator
MTSTFTPAPAAVAGPRPRRRATSAAQAPVDAPATALTGAAGVVARLRLSVREGRLLPGSRLAEVAVAESLGVSRTPVRLAFRTLAEEGLLQPAGKRGYVVRAFSADDVRCAVEVRGALEGLAARRLAERGLSAEQSATLTDCLRQGDLVLAQGHLDDAAIAAWGQLNRRFHHTIVQADDSPVIASAIARNDHLPFASADSITVRADALDREFDKLRIAQLQHRLVVEALQQGESARVEQLMREHALIGVRYAGALGVAEPVQPGAKRSGSET